MKMRNFVRFIFYFLAIFTNLVLAAATVSSQEETQLDPGYDAIVGLGPNCTAKSAINQYCSKKSAELEITDTDKITFGSYPFDWMCILNYRKLIENLHMNFLGFFKKESLSLLAHDYDGKVYKSVYDSSNEMLWNHLFSKPDDYETTPEIFESEYAEKSEKISYLLEKFKNLKEKRTLYVIVSPAFSADLLLELVSALKSYRQENTNFTLLCFHQSAQEYDLENLSVRHLDSVAFSNMSMARFSEVIENDFPLKIFKEVH